MRSGPRRGRRQRAGRAPAVSRLRRLGPAAGLLALLAGCSEPDAATPRPAAVPTVAARTPPAPTEFPATSPLSQRQRRTTSGAIALANLDEEIAALEVALAARPDDLGADEALVDRLATRAVVRGRLADYERAADLAERAAARHPDSAPSLLVRAGARATLHRFTAALEDVAAAERLGAGPAATEPLRADLLEETGRLDAALVLRERLTARQRDLFTLGAEAVTRGRRGDTAAAERLFVEAQHQYRDVAPFPFAWLYLQQGLMWERSGDDERARVLWLAALERIPDYAPAAGHLAALEARAGRSERAIDLLRPLVDTSDDPEYMGQLAELYARTGLTAQADGLRRLAAERFDEIVARHPEAFSAKAARFWLGPGGDPQRALRLAEVNLQARQTDDDRALLAAAQAAATAR